MIEAEEIRNELEQPTETDVRLLFADIQKPMEALQRLFVSAIDEMKKDNINVSYTSLEIERNKLIVRLGDYVLYHEVNDRVLDLMEGRR